VPTIEFPLGEIHRRLSIAIRSDKDITYRVTRVPCQKVPALALNNLLHGRVIPDASIIVGTLPIHINVVD
jgi:hypothetical protein